jgi:hypothetical protein
MRKQMKVFTGGGALFSPAAKSRDAARRDIAYSDLKSALVACFVEIGNSLSFEGGKINRVSALDFPISLDSRSSSAAFVVAACKASVGVKPPFTIPTNSLGRLSGSSSKPNAILMWCLRARSVCGGLADEPGHNR